MLGVDECACLPYIHDFTTTLTNIDSGDHPLVPLMVHQCRRQPLVYLPQKACAHVCSSIQCVTLCGISCELRKIPITPFSIPRTPSQHLPYASHPFAASFIIFSPFATSSTLHSQRSGWHIVGLTSSCSNQDMRDNALQFHGLDVSVSLSIPAGKICTISCRLLMVSPQTCLAASCAAPTHQQFVAIKCANITQTILRKRPGNHILMCDHR